MNCRVSPGGVQSSICCYGFLGRGKGGMKNINRGKKPSAASILKQLGVSLWDIRPISGMPPKVLHHLRNESTVPCGNGNEAAWCMRSQPHPTSLAPAALLLCHCAPWLLAHLGGFANVPHPVASLVYCRGTSSWGCKVSCEKYIELRENQRKGSEKSKVRSQGLCAMGPCGRECAGSG